MSANQDFPALRSCEYSTIAYNKCENRTLVLDLVEEDGCSSIFCPGRILFFASGGFRSVYLGTVSVEGRIGNRKHVSLIRWSRRGMEWVRCHVSEATASTTVLSINLVPQPIFLQRPPAFSARHLLILVLDCAKKHRGAKTHLCSANDTVGLKLAWLDQARSACWSLPRAPSCSLSI